MGNFSAGVTSCVAQTATTIQRTARIILKKVNAINVTTNEGRS